MPHKLFDCFGVEIEYMIVDQGRLNVLPIANELLRGENGRPTGDVERGPIAWSNELVLHVIELKTNGPAADLTPLAAAFQADVATVNAALQPYGACLLPTGMHPTMNPTRDTHLWPHEYNDVYQTFDRIFDCRGHGWANLQSTHLNLPFTGDDEFGRLHAAIRVLLPILPALTASTPLVDGRPSGLADTRLEVYRSNARKIPSVTGAVIPEPAFTRGEYERQILEPIYRDLTPHDPDGVLRHEWVNARGAIARFDRDAIEIRVLDTQECPAADLAVLRLIVAALQALVAERWSTAHRQRAAGVRQLERLLLRVIRDGDQARLDDPSYVALFGPAARSVETAGDLWRALAGNLYTAPERNSTDFAPLRVILEQGCLARRIVAALEGRDDPETLRTVYRRLAECLANGTPFEIAPSAADHLRARRSPGAGTVPDAAAS